MPEKTKEIKHRPDHKGSSKKTFTRATVSEAEWNKVMGKTPAKREDFKKKRNKYMADNFEKLEEFERHSKNIYQEMKYKFTLMTRDIKEIKGVKSITNIKQ